MNVLIGRALKGMVPLNASFNDVFRGDIQVSDGSIRRGFIKDLDARQLGNELLAAALGRVLGLNTAEGALVLVGSDASSSFSKLPHANGKDFVAFCSIDVGGQTVAQMIRSSALSGIMAAFKKSPQIGRLYGFDTWIANIDRHCNNLILHGDGSFHMIDHGHCFSGPNWRSYDLNAAAAYQNRLNEWLTPMLNNKDKDDAMADIVDLTSRLARLDIQKISERSLSPIFHGESDSDSLIGFLEARVIEVPSLSAIPLETI